jgi:hypothetical protein
MKLVSSNEAPAVKSTIAKTMAAYRNKANTATAIDALTKFKGVGPATASLLLAVHDPDSVLFFSDEAFWWLCCGGKKDPIKYNTKEYQTLNAKAQELGERLGVKAVEVEKVAYVVMKDGAPEATPAKPKPGASTARGKTSEPKPKPLAKKKSHDPPPAKRKQNTDEHEATQGSLRRSKRGKTG